MTEKVTPISQVETGWRALRLFSLYRIILSGFFLGLIIFKFLPDPFGIYNPELFKLGVVTHLITAIISLLLVHYRRPSFRDQVFIQIIVDFAVFGVMMYASGGVNSGLGLLLAMSVAAGSLLLIGRVAYLFAATGTLVILIVESFVLFNETTPISNFTKAGLLGAVLFATAMLAHFLAVRIRESETLAAQRGEDLVNLSRMNERIVQRMRSGLMVLSNEGIIQLANISALRLLEAEDDIEGQTLQSISQELDAHMRSWIEGDQATRILRPASRSTDIQVSFTYLGEGLGSDIDSDILAFLEDAAMLRQKAQQLKLASLGQLTASIAHEIRNPLGAISHAGQLLSESPSLKDSDQRLIEIIENHSLRVNQIIENTLRLGRRDDSVPESFLIKSWLEKFIEDFKLQHGLSDAEIIYRVEPSDMRVVMDQNQLHQVIANLAENALRYSIADPKIEIHCYVKDATERPKIDVIDRGPGIAPEQADQIFEPFFTDRSGGTGLGLYIAGELCEANQALLALEKNTSEGCCFRITFAHPDKQIHIE
ncbi:MAG: ATP-binding protein [Gammaproteobacteria bacterium]